MKKNKNEQIIKQKKNDLEYQNKLLKAKIDGLEKSINLKNKEINKLKNKDSSTPTKIPQIVREKHDENFKKDSLPKYIEKIDRLKNLEKEYQNITEEEYINMPPLKKVNLNMSPLKKVNLNTQPLKKVNLNTQPLEKVNIKDLEKTIKKMIFMNMN